MERLSQVQQNPGARRPFRSDGCSGGLSAGWAFAARHFQRFQQRFGDHPPWEACCRRHDRAYWKGEARNGVAKRLQADQALQRCVAATGQRLKTELARDWQISKTQVVQVFDTTAELMYAAVRAGGMPCTGLPWRWGYGWPPCPVINAPESLEDSD
mgnify:CR=1 FL=1